MNRIPISMTNDPEQVIRFTQTEGGFWYKWNYTSKLTLTDLLNVKLENKAWIPVYVKEKHDDVPVVIRIHSVKLRNGRYWDCKNGLRKTDKEIAQAQQRARAINKLNLELTEADRLADMEANLKAYKY